ncbi:MAG: hypothetical protein ABIQ11_01965 [Saprospiraceae bacterium]
MTGYQEQKLKISINYKILLIMKNQIFRIFSILLVTILITSCATVFGGKVSDCQRTKPAEGEPAREIRAVALIADILLFWPGVVVDFLTGAIYKPCGE